MKTHHKHVIDYRLLYDRASFTDWPISEAENRAGGFAVRDMFRRGERLTHVVTSGGVIRVEVGAS